MRKPTSKPPTTPKVPKRGLTKLDTPTHAHESAPLPVWRAAFLTSLAATANASEAAAAAKITRQRAYQVRAENADFAQDWDAAIEIAADALEEEARRRATGYYISYKFKKNGSPLRHPLTGEPYAERCVSDALLTLLLKAHRPEKYKDRSAVETSQAALKPYDLSRLSPEELAQLEAITRAATPPELPA